MAKKAFANTQCRRRANALFALLAVAGPSLVVTGIVFALAMRLAVRPWGGSWLEYLVVAVCFAVGLPWTYTASRWRRAKTPVEDFYKAMKSGFANGLVGGALAAYAVSWAGSIQLQFLSL
ncbi:MAG TPA: hypothetical protein VFO38_06485 [Candidatus Saccharimonadales bacterium]|nr:hypothetical protein [Candidatus Saccharimonadales bacterium]